MHFGREGAVELCFPTSEDVVFCINTNIRMTMLQQLRIQKRYYRVKLYYLRECLIFFQYSITQNLDCQLFTIISKVTTNSAIDFDTQP